MEIMKIHKKLLLKKELVLPLMEFNNIYSYNELTKLLGMARQTIYLIFSNKQQPTSYFLANLCTLL
ncbi:MAG: hypothetical protein LBT99_02770, partial [Bifidobacteriaceae bacterium]|nr:hypothetical protein [Bifidobacteriaceae bacterium]